MIPNYVEMLGQWLEPIDAMPLECDGATRVISALLQREGLSHTIEVGELVVAGVGRIPLHWWIRLGQQRTAGAAVVIDYRARMWLGDDSRVPHGVFVPHADAVDFRPRGEIPPEDASSPMIFWVLAGKALDDFPHLSELAVDPGDGHCSRLRCGRG